MSAFACTEGLINSRSLTYQSADASDVSPVTPKHFLFAQLGGQFAPEKEERISYGIKRMRHVQLVVQCFWKHWMLELVPPLNRRKKRQSVRRNVKVGKVILVISVDVPHRQWFLGCAVEVVEGNDGFARVVKIQVCGIVVTHLIMKIYPLEVNQGNQNIITVCHGRGE